MLHTNNLFPMSQDIITTVPAALQQQLWHLPQLQEILLLLTSKRGFWRLSHKTEKKCLKSDMLSEIGVF